MKFVLSDKPIFIKNEYGVTEIHLGERFQLIGDGCHLQQAELKFSYGKNSDKLFELLAKSGQKVTVTVEIEE